MRTTGLFVMAGLLCSCVSMAPVTDGPATAFRLTLPGLAGNAMRGPKKCGQQQEESELYRIECLAAASVAHWVAYGIPANVTSLAEGEASGPSDHIVRGKGTIGTDLYAGPCPPTGNAPQHYVFTLIATDLEPDALKTGLTETELLESLKGHNLRAASLALRYAH